MTVTAIKFDNGTYYAGCNKIFAKTLLGAQLYKSEKTAQNIIDKSIKFPQYKKKNCSIVKIKLEEYGE